MNKTLASYAILAWFEDLILSCASRWFPAELLWLVPSRELYSFKTWRKKLYEEKNCMKKKIAWKEIVFQMGRITRHSLFEELSFYYTTIVIYTITTFS